MLYRLSIKVKENLHAYENCLMKLDFHCLPAFDPIQQQHAQTVLAKVKLTNNCQLQPTT